MEVDLVKGVIAIDQLCRNNPVLQSILEHFSQKFFIVLFVLQYFSCEKL